MLKLFDFKNISIRGFISRPSIGALILANLLPLAGVVFFGWSIFELIFVFWLENVIIGIMNIVRMLTLLFLRGQIGAIFFVPFFTVHYGMFTYVHGVFIFSIFGPKSVADDAFNLVAICKEMIFNDEWAMIAALGLFASHFFSYIWNFIYKGEYKKTDISKLMTAPYGRIVILHITILIGGALSMATGQHIIGLIMLILLKMAVDIESHEHEHKKMIKT